jgi:hypothetical protein
MLCRALGVRARRPHDRRHRIAGSHSSAPRKASLAVGGGWEGGIECRLFGSSGNPGSERFTPKS